MKMGGRYRKLPLSVLLNSYDEKRLTLLPRALIQLERGYGDEEAFVLLRLTGSLTTIHHPDCKKALDNFELEFDTEK